MEQEEAVQVDVEQEEAVQVNMEQEEADQEEAYKPNALKASKAGQPTAKKASKQDQPAQHQLVHILRGGRLPQDK